MAKPYPSQIRYNYEHPTMTIRMTRYEKQEIESLALKSGKKPSQLVRDTLLKAVKDYQNAYDQGYNNGHKRSVTDWRIWYFCNKCKKILYIQPNTEPHKAVIQYMADHGWAHQTCTKQ
jgi:hypothetical protein